MPTHAAGALLTYCIAHLLVHFLVFVFRFRHSKSASSERAIFVFHFSSACGLAAVAGIAITVFQSQAVIAAACASIFIHGVYSLTFLELWTLAQISYSRDVLEKAGAGPLDTTVLGELATVGDRKRNERLAALTRSGLVKVEDNRWTLSPRGRIVSAALALLLWLPATRSSG